MTAIDTSTWLSNDHFWSDEYDQLFPTYSNNGTGDWTLSESRLRNSQGAGTSTYHGWRAGIPVGRLNDWFQYAEGFSVRPPQHITWQGPQNQHIHLNPVIRGLRVYTTTSGGNRVPTGVVGLEMNHYAMSSTTNYAFPNFNSAQYEIDLYAYNSNDTDKYIRITNFPITTTGYGSTIVFSTSDNLVSWIFRGGTGTTRVKRATVTHNTNWELVGWDVNEVANYTGRLIFAYRIHSAVTPYTISNNVTFNQVILNPGVYNAVPNIPLAVQQDTYTITFAGGGALSVSGAVPGVSLEGGGTTRFGEISSAMLSTQEPLRGNEVVRLSGGGELRIRDASTTLEGGGTFRITGTGNLDGSPVLYILEGHSTASFEGNGSLSVNGVDPGSDLTTGRGFIPVIVHYLMRR